MPRESQINAHNPALARGFKVQKAVGGGTERNAALQQTHNAMPESPSRYLHNPLIYIDLYEIYKIAQASLGPNLTPN
ncbi:hypothetical protein [Cupriavidus sp. SK-3]|uniref:hypothetical protein n=1 Tax=Cupriavidus sp. SK-3 TaxID=1470558 RepID=UPI0012683413|nr:hypothetical protein [Cupriavidus sp. SK-3]